MEQRARLDRRGEIRHRNVVLHDALHRIFILERWLQREGPEGHHTRKLTPKLDMQTRRAEATRTTRPRRYPSPRVDRYVLRETIARRQSHDVRSHPTPSTIINHSGSRESETHSARRSSRRKICESHSERHAIRRERKRARQQRQQRRQRRQRQQRRQRR